MSDEATGSEDKDAAAHGFDLRAQLLSASLRASARARHVLLLLQGLTLLVSVALFNSWSHNWTTARIAVFERARRVAECVPGAFPGVPIEDKQILEHTAADLVSRSRACISANVIDTDKERWKDSVKYVLRGGYTKKDIMERLHSLTSFWSDVVTAIPIPLTGHKIDINGLGMLAGLGFNILLLWLLVAMRRENDNFVHLLVRFPEASPLIEANQVFTLVPRHVEKPTLSQKAAAIAMALFRWAGGIPGVTFLFPIGLLSLICWSDVQTVERARWADPIATWVTLGIEGLCLLVNVALAALCVAEQRRVLFAVDRARDEAEASLKQPDRRVLAEFVS